MGGGGSSRQGWAGPGCKKTKGAPHIRAAHYCWLAPHRRGSAPAEPQVAGAEEKMLSALMLALSPLAKVDFHQTLLQWNWHLSCSE